MRRPKARAPRMSRVEMEDAIANIRRDYADFVARGSGVGAEDPKGFTTHHNAGRAALNHLEQLLDLTEGGDANADEVNEALTRARDAMNADLQQDRADDDGDNT